MKNKLEYILLSILLGLSVLLGLSFWLNTIFNFNIFCATHWTELARLQASKTPVNIGFYVSFAVAIFIFTIGLYFIYRSSFKIITVANEDITHGAEQTQNNISNDIPNNLPQQENNTSAPADNRPPRLRLPGNIAQIAEQNHIIKTQQKPKQDAQYENKYNQIISEIFSDNGYLVKPNPSISGFVPNLFAIGNNEVVWVGGVDCDIEKMKEALQRLDSVFRETLEDIQININAFVLDTLNKYDSTNNDLFIFKSIEDLKAFITEHPADDIEEIDTESFDSYSEYIDTIIKYIKNI